MSEERVPPRWFEPDRADAPSVVPSVLERPYVARVGADGGLELHELAGDVGPNLAAPSINEVLTHLSPLAFEPEKAIEVPLSAEDAERFAREGVPEEHLVQLQFEQAFVRRLFGGKE